MKLTCSQIDVLISFYIEGELSPALKQQIEKHFEDCPTCQAKYDIVKSMFADIKSSVGVNDNTFNTRVTESSHYKQFQNDLSAYIDNELDDDESLKIKKFAINNQHARKELEDSYQLRKLMNDSFRKTKAEAKRDFSKSIMKDLELEHETAMNFHPAVKLLIAFTLSVLILSTIILISLNM